MQASTCDSSPGHHNGVLVEVMEFVAEIMEMSKHVMDLRISQQPIARHPDQGHALFEPGASRVGHAQYKLEVAGSL